MSKVTTFTHSQLVDRGARWLKNTYGCRVVLTENAACSGEIPDVIGWKSSGRSVLIECKTSRADFIADASKSFRVNPDTALGAERYFMVPAGLVKPLEIPVDWGLVAVKGNGCSVVVPCRPRKDMRSDRARSNETRMLISALERISIRMEPVQLNEWLKYRHKNDSPTKMQNCVSPEDQQLHLSSLSGWVQVVDPLDLPSDEDTGLPWCPKHELPFSDCACVGPNEQHVLYRTIEGQSMAKPMALHLGKFPAIVS
jgi:hypothetical protein